MRHRNSKYAMAALAFFLFIGMNVPYETSKPYLATEIYTVEEPYIDFNYYNYTVNESYVEEIPLNYTVLDARYKNDVSSPSYLWIDIMNTDTEGGYFNVDFHITIKVGIPIPMITKISSTGNYISSGETKTVKVSYNETITEFTYDLIPPTKEVIKNRNVTMQKIETKYRKVQKTREVIKFKNESTSIISSLWRIL